MAEEYPYPALPYATLPYTTLRPRRSPNASRHLCAGACGDRTHGACGGAVHRAVLLRCGVCARRRLSRLRGRGGRRFPEHCLRPLCSAPRRYSLCRAVNRFTMTDLCELARNSVLISDFPPDVKRRWIGDNYRLEARTAAPRE